MAASYASGNWHVKEGEEAEFVSRWKEFLGWTRERAAGFQGARLIQDAGNPRHFVSFAEWVDDQSQEAWRAAPEFAAKLGACRELCEEFQGGQFGQVVAI